MSGTFRIHPSIGIARLGDSPDEYFIGPEAPRMLASLSRPGVVSATDGTHRDAQQRIKRQGQRFRIFEYAHDESGALQPVREITSAEADIEWEVHLANRKAAATEFNAGARRNPRVDEHSLIIDAGAQRIGGTAHEPVPLHGSFMGLNVQLGDLLTDSAGRLIVLGGFGHSESVPPGMPLNSYANNDGWHDDISDGPVRATVRLHGSAEVAAADAAWVLVAPPDFVPQIQNIITLYDIVYNMMARFDPSLAVNAATRLSFTRDIFPILRRVSHMHWVSDNASRHKPGQRGYFLARLSELSSSAPEHAAARQGVFNRLRNPDNPGASRLANMPKLPNEVIGSEVAGATLTQVQYAQMAAWAKGEFEADWAGSEPAPVALAELPARDQPEALDQAPLLAAVGAGRFPGIEAGNIMLERETFDPRRPFRINEALPPGSLTARMAVPWQADFRDCEFEAGGYDWWPGQRPNEVWRVAGDALRREKWRPQTDEWMVDEDNDIVIGRHTMVARWSGLGFILAKEINGEIHFVEDERTLDG